MLKSGKNSEIAGKKEQLKSFLKEGGFKSTRQRDIITTEFLNNKGHITAEELYRIISKKHKDIGFTTVSRTTWVSGLVAIHPSTPGSR